MTKQWESKDFNNCYKESIKTFENGFDHAKKQGIPDFIEKHRLSRIKDHIAQLIIKGDGQNILDIGCGHGWYMFHLIDFWHYKGKITGIDISQHNINILNNEINKRDLSKKLYAICANCEQLPFKNDSFDTIYATESIEHIENPTKMFIEAHRVLQNNGTFFITTPSKYIHNLWKIIFFIPQQIKRLILKNLGKNIPEIDKNITIYEKTLSFKEIETSFTNGGFELISYKKALLLPHESYFQFCPKSIQYLILYISKTMELFGPLTMWLGLHHIITLKVRK